MKHLLVLLSLLISPSLLANDIDRAIEQAKGLILNNKCYQAQSLLENVGRQNRHAEYLLTLSKAYACGAKYNPDSVVDDLYRQPVFGYPSLIGSLTKVISHPLVRDINDDLYARDLQKSINILLYAGGIPRDISPLPQYRREFFNEEDAKKIDLQLNILLASQLGRFFKYYGNASAEGVKGEGEHGNFCIANYSDIGSIDAYLDATAPGTCNSHGLFGHSDLGNEGHLDKLKMCQAIALYNNYKLTMPVREFPLINPGVRAMDLAETVMTTAEPTTDKAAQVLSINKCVREVQDNDLQYFFVYIFETLFD